ncbi:hypothetical protein [Streptomyces sp. NPDC002276]
MTAGPARRTSTAEFQGFGFADDVIREAPRPQDGVLVDVRS